MEWTEAWEAALEESDAAFRDAEKSRLDQAQHIGRGQDAEADFVDVMIRLRRYIDSRASRHDKARIAEGQRLIAPLLSAMKKMKTERLARATRRENAGQDAPAPSPAPADGNGKPAAASAGGGGSSAAAPTDGGSTAAPADNGG
jgi:hypothetical protein